MALILTTLDTESRIFILIQSVVFAECTKLNAVMLNNVMLSVKVLSAITLSADYSYSESHYGEYHYVCHYA